MRTIFAEYNPKRNSIDVYTSVGYMLRIDCWEAKCSLASSGLALLPKHRIRSGRNEFRYYETKWCQNDH